MTGDVVLDASVIVAAVLKEPGGGSAVGHPRAPLVSAVNYAEARSRLVDVGMTQAAIGEAFEILQFDIVAFDADQAESVASLRVATRGSGLSLGDRACLALAMSRKARALTADRAWAKVKVPVDVELVR